VKTPASIIPAMLAGRSKEGASAKAVAAAAANVPPSISRDFCQSDFFIGARASAGSVARPYKLSAVVIEL
jgi:hypothetical protein